MSSQSQVPLRGSREQSIPRLSPILVTAGKPWFVASSLLSSTPVPSDLPPSLFTPLLLHYLPVLARMLVATSASHFILIILDHPCLEALLLIISGTALSPDEVTFTGYKDGMWCFWSSNRAGSCLPSLAVAVLACIAQRVHSY